MKKYVYLFSEGDASMRNLLGGKAQTCRDDRFRPAGPQGFHCHNGSLHPLLSDGK